MKEKTLKDSLLSKKSFPQVKRKKNSLGYTEEYIEHCEYWVHVCECKSANLKPYYFKKQLKSARQRLRVLRLQDYNTKKKLKDFKNPCGLIKLISLNKALKRFQKADEGFLSEEHKKRDAKKLNQIYEPNKKFWNGVENYFWDRDYCYVGLFNYVHDPSTTKYPFKYLYQEGGFHDEFKILVSEYREFTMKKKDYWREKKANNK
jgi:hypothetical protein